MPGLIFKEQEKYFTVWNNKKTILIIVVSICAILLLFLLIANVAVSFNPFDNGGCISVALDKPLMMKADRIIIRVGERQYEITDHDIIRKIIAETKVATNTDLRYPSTDRWIDVYCGNILVRSMMWEDNHNQIIVYNNDRLHWIFPSDDGEGIVHPSSELIAVLEEIIA